MSHHFNLQERDQRREQVSATFDTKHIVGERFSSGSSYAATERERRSNEDADIIQSPTDRLHKAVTMSLMVSRSQNLEVENTTESCPVSTFDVVLCSFVMM